MLHNFLLYLHIDRLRVAKDEFTFNALAIDAAPRIPIPFLVSFRYVRDEFTFNAPAIRITPVFPIPVDPRSSVVKEKFTLNASAIAATSRFCLRYKQSSTILFSLSYVI